MSKKKILVFIDWFLPGERAGGPVRSCANLLDHLNAEFDFSVVTRNTDYTQSTPYPGINSDQWNILRDGKRIYYFSDKELSRAHIGKIISEEKPDVIYVNGIWSEPFTHWPLLEAKGKIKTVVAVRGMLASSALAIKKTKKKLFLSYAKIRGMFSDVIFHATTEKEKEEVLKNFGTNASVIVAPNLPRKSAENISAKKKQGGALRLVSVARISPEKNTLFALEVLSHLKENVIFDHYGTTYNDAYKSECDEMKNKIPGNVQVNFHDAVPSSSVPGLLARYDFLFLPTRGENFGHVILESLQAGTPVIISDQTPWRQLEKDNSGWDLPLSELQKFVSAIESAGEMSDEEYFKWSTGALARASKYVSEEKNIELNRSLFV